MDITPTVIFVSMIAAFVAVFLFVPLVRGLREYFRREDEQVPLKAVVRTRTGTRRTYDDAFGDIRYFMRPVNSLLCTFYATLFTCIAAAATLVTTESDMTAAYVVFCMLAILTLSLAIAYIVSLARCFKSLAADSAINNADALFKKMKRVKWGFAPFWALCAILAALYLKTDDTFYLLHLLLPSSLIWPFFLTAITVFNFPLTIVAFCAHLICTSIFSLTYLRLLRRNGTISKLQFTVHAILQFIFIADVVDTIVLVIQRGKSGSAHRGP